jgi:BMFP domain-containing protein YqiC
MIDPNILDELSNRVANSMPKGFQVLQNDLQHNLRMGLEGTLSKLNLVTREEFDIQQAVLMRTRAKVDALEKQLSALEQQLAQK